MKKKWITLTPRETEVYDLLLQGGNKNTIAKRLFVAPCTVATHINSIFLKKTCNSVNELMARRIKELEKTIEDMKEANKVGA